VLKNQSKKHDGSPPIVGVNTFLQPDGHVEVGAIELTWLVLPIRNPNGSPMRSAKSEGRERRVSSGSRGWCSFLRVRWRVGLTSAARAGASAPAAVLARISGC